MAQHSFKQGFWLSICLFFTTFLRLALASEAPPSVTYVSSKNSLNNLTVALNVPQNNTDDLYFRYSAPVAYGWTAFGFGNQMKDSLIFVFYPSANGRNVTVSPRLGTGHQMPKYTKDVTIEYFEGTGIDSKGNVVVNAKCTGCRSWGNGLKIDTASTAQSMIWAYGPGSSTLSDDPEESIAQHKDDFGTFTIDLSKAVGVGGVPTTTPLDNTTNTGSSTSGKGFNGTAALHAALMIAAFLILFPGGYLCLRLFEKVIFHQAFQSLAVVVVAVGSGIGVAMSKNRGIHPNLDSPHQIIGLVLLALLFITWGLGFAGHMIYRKTGQPAKIMLGHRFLGPFCMSLGLINVCIGFNLAGNTKPIIGFVIISVIVMVAITAVIYWKRRRSMRKNAMMTPAAMNFRSAQHDGPNGGFEAAGTQGQHKSGAGIQLQEFK